MISAQWSAGQQQGNSSEASPATYFTGWEAFGRTITAVPGRQIVCLVNLCYPRGRIQKTKYLLCVLVVIGCIQQGAPEKTGAQTGWFVERAERELRDHKLRDLCSAGSNCLSLPKQKDTFNWYNKSQLKLSFGANIWTRHGHLSSEFNTFKMIMGAWSRG